MNRLGERVARGPQQALKHELHIGIVLGKLRRGGRGHAADREDGALGGLHDGLVGRLDAGGEGGGKLLRVCRLQALQGLGNAAEQQRQNDAGIAAGAAQQRVRRALARRADLLERLLRERDGGGVHGQAHVGAGIAVRHGEYVQIIDGLLVLFQCRVRAQEHFLKRGGIDPFSQNSAPPKRVLIIDPKQGRQKDPPR